MSQRSPIKLILAHFLVWFIVIVPIHFAIDPPSISGALLGHNHLIPALSGMFIVVALSVFSISLISYLLDFIKQGD